MAVDKFPVEEGAILMFARAIGDPNPIYSDSEYASTTEVGGIIAPPTFVQSSAQFDPDYRLRPRIGEPWLGSGRNPTGVPGDEKGGSGGTGLHAEQEFIYHRPLRPGDVLHTTDREGKTWEKQGRSGKLVFNERFIDYHDERGNVVVTARTVAVRTERPVPQEGK